MGVYVKGMEMPNKCFGCPFCKGIGYNPKKEHGQQNYVDCKRLGRVYIDALEINSFEIFILPNCPLVEVSEPHGRLIDGDELKTAFPICDNSTSILVASVRATINHAPTVIDAEGE